VALVEVYRKPVEISEKKIQAKLAEIWGENLGRKCLIISDFGVTMMSTRIDNKGGAVMATTTEKLTSEIQSLTDVEKLHLVDTILADLDRPDPELDRIWAEESRKRWSAYKEGRIPSVSYQDVMDKYRRV